MTTNTPQLNGGIEIQFTFSKEGSLEILLNSKFNESAQKILWSEAVYTCKRMRNSLTTTNSTKTPFGIFYGENPMSLVHSQSSDILGTPQ